DAARAVISLVLVRLVDLALVLAAVVMGLLLRRTGEGAPPLLPTAAALAAFGLLLAAFRPTLRLAFAIAARLSARLGQERFPVVGKVLGKLQAAVADGESLDRGQMARVALCSLGIFTCQTALFY